MPKRIVHGEGVWRSDKLAKVEPEWVRAEYANWLPLSLANGVFECAPRRVWAEIYSYNRPAVTVNMVADVIRPAFEKAGLLFVWSDSEGRQWGFWIGITKSGRLPAPSRLKKGHDAVGPKPPARGLQQYLKSHRNGSGQLLASHEVASGQVGFGSGFGIGSGNGECASHTPAVCPPPETLLTIWKEEHGRLPEVQDFTEERRKKCRTRLNKHSVDVKNFLSRFRQAISKANQTPFLRGEGSKGWRADFDWFIANDTNFVKVLEGKYDSGNGSADQLTTRNLAHRKEFLGSAS